MEQDRPSVLDLRRSARLWQRVAPGMEPFAADAVPAMASGLRCADPVPAPAAAPASEPASPAPASQASPSPVTPSPAPSAPAETAAAAPVPEGGSSAALSALPGAITDPCCMGSDAADMLGVVTGFADEASARCRSLTALARQAPVWARQQLRQAAAREDAHTRQLMAVYYLITGTCCPMPVCRPVPRQNAWCPALREQYHLAACAAFNYARAAEGTADPCLARIFEALSRQEYQTADTLTALLERSLGC